MTRPARPVSEIAFGDFSGDRHLARPLGGLVIPTVLKASKRLQVLTKHITSPVGCQDVEMSIDEYSGEHTVWCPIADIENALEMAIDA